jgi:dethiobiotin synthetase
VTTDRPGVFLVGTDTGVGKTAVGCALLRLALRLGRRPVPVKPVETGCDPDPADALRLRSAAARPDLALSLVCPYQFPLPVAPAQAAPAAGVELTAPALQGAIDRAATHGDFLLVESAGGLLSPYGPALTGADLAAGARLPLLLVARNALGTINHTALALAEIRRRALPLAGLVLVEVSSHATPDRPHNAALIEAVSGDRALATLPFIADADADRLADELVRQIPPAQLFARFGLGLGG